MPTTVIINDYMQDKQFYLLFNSTEFEKLNNFWNTEDKLLIDLQTNDLFKNKTTWASLETVHFRVLIIQNLVYLNELTPDEQKNESNSVNQSLHFLLMGLIKCIENKTQSNIELLHVNRYDKIDVAFDYTASLNATVEIPMTKQTKKKKPKLEVVVNNENIN